MKKITSSLNSEISKKAKKSIRKRQNYNFHVRHSDPINRLINAVEPGAYFPPHKHTSPKKREIFIILTGQVLVVEFADSGKIKDYIMLDAKKGNYGVEISPDTWHSVIPLKSSVLYEIKDGPYDKKTDKIFAGWAPKEIETGSKKFVEKILKKLEINV